MPEPPDERFLRDLGALVSGPHAVLVAVSGGPDSLALLVLLSRTRDRHGLELTVGHVDHGIHPDSGRVAERVAAIVSRHQLPLRIGRLGLGPGTTETEARRARYAWLRTTADALTDPPESALLLTAHHAGDQAETVLMRFLAGSGLAGLAGMSPRQGRLIRPLLGWTPAELAEVVAASGEEPWDDPANRAPEHLRSWLRHEVLSGVRRRIPQVDQNLLRVREAASVDRTAWQELLEQLPGLGLTEKGRDISVAVKALTGYDSSLALRAIQALGTRAGRPIGLARARRVLALAQGGRSGSRVDLGGGWSGVLHFGRFSIRGPAGLEEGQGSGAGFVELSPGTVVHGRRILRCTRDTAPAVLPRRGFTTWVIPSKALGVRVWAPGDRIRPLGMTGRKRVARCLQEARIPLHDRGDWPVVVDAEGRVVWLAGVCRSDVSCPAPGTEAWRIDVGIA